VFSVLQSRILRERDIGQQTGLKIFKRKLIDMDFKIGLFRILDVGLLKRYLTNQLQVKSNLQSHSVIEQNFPFYHKQKNTEQAVLLRKTFRRTTNSLFNFT
jgi:hypothetical protein